MKLKKLLLVLVLFLTIIVPINADEIENEDYSNKMNMTSMNLESSKLNEHYKILSTSDNEMTIYFYEDDVTFEFIKEDDEITVIDHLTGEVVFVSKVTYYDVFDENHFYQNQNTIRLFGMKANYENWNIVWSEYRRGHIQLPSTDADSFISITAGLLLTNCGILGLAAATVISIATSYRDRNLNGAYFIQYYRTNIDCGILAKTYSKYFTSSSYSESLGSSPEGYMWTDTPWDYSKPAPCRVLVNTYPL